MRSDNMKNILRPGFARTYSLLMDLASDFLPAFILHIFCAHRSQKKILIRVVPTCAGASKLVRKFEFTLK